MNTESAKPGAVRHYFVDEAGDPNLFGGRSGRVIAGTVAGCSRFFMLGKVEVDEPEALAEALTALRLRLLDDPYFKGVPSMDPERGRTAAHFHAKDDPAEVRREVFGVLAGFEMRFYAHIRDKQVIAQKVLDHNKRNPRYRYRPNQLYDRCIGPLFENRLHQHESYRIVFARRGSNDRTESLKRGLQQARDRFREKWGIEGVSPVEVVASDPARVVCLQAADYFLWALQRCFERGERRYIDLLWPKVGLIVDRDDARQSGAGAYYTRTKPLPDDVRTAIADPGAARGESDQ